MVGQSPKTPTRPSQEVLDLYDKYAHGFIDRRMFMRRLSAFAVGGLTITALADSVLPNYALACCRA